MAKSRARDISEKTIKRLYALSGNQCAFPSCNITLLSSDSEINYSNICHIEAAEPGGQRYNIKSNDDYRRSYGNLLLLCANHHLGTNDEAKFPEAILQAMKKNHEVEVLKLISGNNILVKNPSALNVIIGYVGKQIFSDTITTEPTNAPNTEEKILYNNVIIFKPIIEEYAIYQGKLNKLYEEIEKQGSSKKEFVLQNIKTIYLKEKGKFRDIDEIRIHADQIIENVENELWKIIENSSNPNLDLPIEAIKISLLIVMVDAFMRCNILEEPPKS